MPASGPAYTASRARPASPSGGALRSTTCGTRSAPSGEAGLGAAAARTGGRGKLLAQPVRLGLVLLPSPLGRVAEHEDLVDEDAAAQPPQHLVHVARVRGSAHARSRAGKAGASLPGCSVEP